MEITNKRQNKALHPTAYSLRYASFLPTLRLPAAGELGVGLLRAAFSAYYLRLI